MTILNIEGDLPQRLADEFSRLIRDSLTVDQMTEVLRRNKTSAVGECATHDFVDSNLSMAQAFVLVIGRQYEPSSYFDAALWNTAWALAKNAAFPRKLDLIENPEGTRVFAYAIGELWIDNPHLSVCTRFPVDAAAYHGLRAEEVAALEHANSLLTPERSLAAQAASPSGPSTVSSLPRGSSYASWIRTLIATVSGLFAFLRPKRKPVSSMADIRARYHDLEEWHTGGGCFALRLDCDGGGYILITESDNAQIPSLDATVVDVGRLAADGEEIEEVLAIEVRDLADWIDGALSRARTPTNVADYFVKHLGASHPDDTLRDLPIDSPCGRDCVKCIDAAAALIGHVSAALGDEDRDASTALTELARRVVEVYWRG